MGSNPLIKSTVTGIVMQVLMVIIGKYVPAVASMPNFYAICGSALAAITGSMVARGATNNAAGSIATNGAIAGGSSSLVGGLMAVATGQWPDFQIVQLLFPLISGAVAGGAGGMIGRMMNKGRAA